MCCAFGAPSARTVSVPFELISRLYEVMDEIAEQPAPHVAPSHDRWSAGDRYVDPSLSEHLKPTTAPAACRLRWIAEERSCGGELDLGDRAADLTVPTNTAATTFDRLHRLDVVHCLLSRSGVAVSGPPRAGRAGRWPSGRCPGWSARPGRVSPEVGSGRSCVRAVGGHTPLQVPLWGTCGAVGARSNVAASDGVVDRANSPVGASSCA